jgi:hypothetical protein
MVKTCLDVANRKGWSENSIIYFHHTLGETVQDSDAGWHSHISVARGSRMTMLDGFKTVLEIHWCEYVVLCAGFKWICKMIEQIVDGKEVPLAKFSELPYPLKPIYTRMGHFHTRGPLNLVGQKIICLQLIILATGHVPDQLIYYKKKNWRNVVWNRMVKYFSKWDHKKNPIHKLALSGSVKLHPIWPTIGSVTGSEFPEWDVCNTDPTLFVSKTD